MALARLPTPKLEQLTVSYDERYEEVENDYYKIIGRIAREEISKAKKGGEKDES